jgi:aspartokinase-like uncharacterized kinase
MHVVKLGGSLYHQPTLLQQWLDILTVQSKVMPVIIVPGGGPFADQVRQAQLRYKFNDHHAHHMALLAMAQFGILLSDLLGNANTFNLPNEVDINSKQQGLLIWLPNSKLLQFSGINQNWDITSDSLSLWLSQQLSSSCLSIVKSIEPTSTQISQLSKDDILDKGFSSLFQQQSVSCDIHYSQCPHEFQVGTLKQPLIL